MVLKYMLLIVSIIGIANTIAKNLQTVDYDENNSAYFGALNLNGFKKIGKKYYWVESNSYLNWWDAYFACRKRNSNLASVSTLQELENLSPHLLQLNSDGWYWVGGKLLNGNFRWLYNGENINSDNMWSSSQLDNSDDNEHCVLLWREGQTNLFLLNDWGCSKTALFVCERDTPVAVTINLMNVTHHVRTQDFI